MNNYSIPKEHGAYVVLVAAWLLGIVYSHSPDVTGSALALILPLSIFFLQEPIRILVRRKKKEKIELHPFALLCIISTLVTGLILTLHSPRILYLTAPLFVIALLYFYFVRKRSAAIILSLVGFLGLALITPLTILASPSVMAPRDLAITWLFAALFFCGSLVCVNIRLSGGSGIWQAILYHILASAVILFFVYVHALPHSAIAVISVSFLRLLLIIPYRKQYSTLRIRYIGIQESVIAGLGVIISALPF